MSREDTDRRTISAVVALLVGVVALWVLYSIRGALIIVYASALLAVGFSPLVRWLERQRLVSKGGLPRWVAILVLYFGLLAVLAVAVAIVLPPLLGQAAALWEQLPADILRLQRFLVRYRLLDHRWTLDDLLKAAPAPGTTVTALFGALQSVIGTIGSAVAVLVLPYYLLVEADTLRDGWLKLFPPAQRTGVARMTNDVTVRVGAWLGGQLLLSAAIGLTSSLGLWLLGVPYFYVLGLLTAVGEFVPIIGPVVAAVPAVLVGWSVSVHTAIFVVVYFSVQQFIEGNVLVPKVMQRQVGVSAWSIVVALLIGSELLGVAGAILAVPSAAIAQVFLQEYLTRDEVAIESS